MKKEIRGGTLWVFLLTGMVWLLLSGGCAPLETKPWTSHPDVDVTHSPEISTSPVNISVPLAIPDVPEAGYRRNPAPVLKRYATDQTQFLADGVGIQSGEYRLEYRETHFQILPPTGETALELTLPGGEEINCLTREAQVTLEEDDFGERIRLFGRCPWGAEYHLQIYAYHFTPGLFRWRLVLNMEEAPPGDAEPELRFVDFITAEEAKGNLEIYAERAPLAAPLFYGFSASLNSTIFYWLDLTSLNPLMADAHLTPSSTPRRIRQRIGHTLSRADLVQLKQNVPYVVYDSYVYLVPGQPETNFDITNRFIHTLADVYDLIAVPEGLMGEWLLPYRQTKWRMPDLIHHGAARATLDALMKDQYWVRIGEQRYLQAYVSDTRTTAEAITQLDALVAILRFAQLFGYLPEYADALGQAVPAFFNPVIPPSGMLQNAGPVSVIGTPERGDTWYELGHAIKLAEVAALSPEDMHWLELAVDNADTWISFAHAAGYRFPQFFSFGTWKGTGREPDTTGAYAYLMMLLYSMRGEIVYLEEAGNALHSLGEYGFNYTYETHMTAMTAAAAARYYQVTDDAAMLDVINLALANILRLSWLWECDYGWMTPFDASSSFASLAGDNPRTFFGISPTQRSAVMTPKEQYETVYYMAEVLQLMHGTLEPDVEKLIAELVKHSAFTLGWSLPPYLPPDAATAHPSAYPEVTQNELEVMIPLEDVRDGWDISGAIGQEIYGAGMAPTMATITIHQVQPGVWIYTGYPVVRVEDGLVTLAGTPGAETPVVVWGATGVKDALGNVIPVERCGSALCFWAQGGSRLMFVVDP